MGQFFHTIPYQAKHGLTAYVEVPVVPRTKRVVVYNFPQDSLKQKPDETVAQRSVQKMAFYLDDSGEIRERFITYIPDKEYLVRRKNEVVLNSIKKRQSDFRGYMEYRDWNGNVTAVLRIVDGKVVRRYHPSATRARSTESTGTASTDCITVCHDEYQIICTSFPDGEGGYGEEECGEQYIGTTCETHCYDDGDDSSDPCPSGDCNGGGGETTPPLDNQVKNQIADKPFALFPEVPCGVLEKWIVTARHTVAQAQITKLNSVVNTSYLPTPGSLTPVIGIDDVAKVQKIDDAYSTVVNLDYFPVDISQLPIINGVRATPQQFLRYIRKNINSFVNTDYAEFTPYHWYGTDDTELWNSNNPLGSVIAIDIAGPDNGSVIVSSSSSNKWTFTTIYDPKFGEHPVSGNRDFGYTANVDGSYTFYTRGVDRLTSWEGVAAQNIPEIFGFNGIPFSQTDKLWISFQSSVYSFVNNNGGKAFMHLGTHIERPNWVEIKDVVDGVKPLSTLNKDCD